MEDDYTDDVDFGSYDKAFGNAAINPNDTENVYIQGKRGKDIFPDKWTDFPMELSTAWNSCAGAFLSIKESGKAVAVMNSGQLTIKQTEAARKYMCDKGCIEGVIILPDKMYTNTWVNPFIVILSYNNNSIRFYDARNECVCGRINGKRQNRFSEENIQRIIEDYHSDDKTAVIQMEVVAKNNYNLNPLLYVTTDISEKTISLKDVLLEVKRGISISAAEMDDNISEEESKEKCIIPSSISGGVVDSKYYYHAEIKKPGKNNASVGDVLLSKTGNPFKIAISRDHYLVIGNIYILQIDKEKISPEYIRCFLSSKQGQKEIAKYAVGSATPVISIANLQKIQIPIFEEKKQKDIEKKAKEVLEEIETCYQQILDDKYEIDSMFS